MAYGARLGAPICTAYMCSIRVTFQKLHCGSVEAPEADDVNAFWRTLLSNLHLRYRDLFITDPAPSDTAEICKTLLHKVCIAKVVSSTL